MGGHIIGPLMAMGDPVLGRIIRVRNQTCKKRGQVGLHVRVGVFLDKQGTGSVQDKHRQQAGLPFRHPCGDQPSDLGQTGSVCRYEKF